MGGLNGTSAPAGAFVDCLMELSRFALKKSANICGVTTSKLLAERGLPSRPLGVDAPIRGVEAAASGAGVLETPFVCD